jgi:hypothetical protein
MISMRAGMLACAVAASGVILSAQRSQTPSPSPPLFRAGADLVTVDALVTDSTGNVVTGLTGLSDR